MSWPIVPLSRYVPRVLVGPGWEKKEPQLEKALLDMVEPETAGDPMSEHKWLRSSLRSLSERLTQAGHQISAPTVGRILQEHDYALRVNAQKKEAGSPPADRDRQFRYIASQQQAFIAPGDPIVSIDTKKKELLGNFNNAGQAWKQEAEAVNVQDFLSEAQGRGVPYGIYDRQHNHGVVYVGHSADTAEFAVEALKRWWGQYGQKTSPTATRLLILADSGGSNGCRPRLWKAPLQSQLSDALGLTITVCQYPTGCSKWNPIAHRLFRFISLNWAGQPLRSFGTMLNLLRGTSTRTGLKVSAHLLEGVFETGKKITDIVMQSLNITRHATCPQGNYTIRPRFAQVSDA